MSKSNIVLNNVVLINNGRAADFLKWIQYSFFPPFYMNNKFFWQKDADLLEIHSSSACPKYII